MHRAGCIGQISTLVAAHNDGRLTSCSLDQQIKSSVLDEPDRYTNRVSAARLRSAHLKRVGYSIPVSLTVLMACGARDALNAGEATVSTGGANGYGGTVSQGGASPTGGILGLLTTGMTAGNGGSSSLGGAHGTLASGGATAPTCQYNGSIYKSGDMFGLSADCEAFCTCYAKGVSCTYSAMCATPPGCSYQGVYHPALASFQTSNGCCTCWYNQLACPSASGCY